jgi:hypothetical protein
MRWLLVALALASSCSDGVDRSIAQVTGPRILAVRAEPPESAPGATVTYAALVATPDGPAVADDLAWTFCTTAPTRAEAGPVNPTCIANSGAPDAIGMTATVKTPADACRRFGPLGMPATNAAAVSQPLLPDASGGYYQPLRLAWQASLALALERLTCDPTGVSLDLAQAYRTARRANANPRLWGLTATIAGQPATGSIAPSASVDLLASWSADAAETYITVDAEQALLLTHTETLWVAWFANDGAIEHDVTKGEGTSAGNRWQAPTTMGTYYVWAVLHDDRGGTDFLQTTFSVD